ncbi:MAG: enoyl-CoA hydratase/isomerase family protein [Rhodobacteraceae bacterium]|jgi:enoyl-CoA hydratase/carnithine racemase|nr:enoyl-CoA hydratase/isomerase family protein [Paracoccaceae bacterium]
MSEGEILLSERRGAVLWLTLNRPKVHNAMNSALVSATHAAIRAASDDEAVRVIVLQGAGTRAFTAGADIGEIAAAGPAEMRAYNRRWLDLFRAIELCPKPVIASVRGWATGGGTETSLACDFVICAESARFGLAEINIGVIPGAGAAVRLTRWVGRLKAKEILMLGRFIPGQEAVALHLAGSCVPDDRLEAATAELADELAGRAPLALAAAKACVNFGADPGFDAGLEFELREFLMLFASEDQKEGMRAFLEKRKPVFRGR